MFEIKKLRQQPKCDIRCLIAKHIKISQVCSNYNSFDNLSFYSIGRPSMKKVLLLCFFLPSLLHTQKITISGFVRDHASGESLIGASIFSPEFKQGTTSNTYGFYSFTIPKEDSVLLRITYVGYQPQQLKFKVSRDTTINVALIIGNTLQEVVVEGSQDEAIQNSTRMGTIDIPIENIKSLPALLGEVDVLKIIQLLPGVQSGSEGSSGLYVRGGGPDQNLILLDGVPVYNASHLFGFFSVFNADAINHVQLVKGGFPARYGGRLSSVIDISMKEGNKNKFKGEGSIGIVASKLTLEGPINKNTSFIISGRRTYIDLLTRPFIQVASNGQSKAGYYFYDFNTKINHRINDRQKIYLSMYTGDDKAYASSRSSHNDGYSHGNSEDAFALQWGNLTTALRWNYIINQKLFSNVTATYSKYRFVVGAKSRNEDTANDSTTVNYFNTKYFSGIRDYALKADFDYLPDPNHYIKFGAQIIAHRFTPGVLSFRSAELPDTTLGAKPTSAREFFIYAEDDFQVSSRFKINAGIHASAFNVNGKTYSSFQPRLAARYLINSNLSWKTSYAQMTQYIHLLSNVGIGLPTDLWVPATPSVGPEQSYLTSTGMAYNLNNKYEFSIETYYKSMHGLIEYKDGANYLNIESDWQTKVERGRGESHGAEFFLQKKTGKVSGWLGYTLSWTNRTFANINEGRTYPYRYDRRHDIQLATSYKWRQNREFSFTWVYGTGNAVTLPQSSYSAYTPYSPYQNQFDNGIQYYNGRNSYRMRAYHRLDISYTTTKKTKWGERSWSIGAYNVYSRRNPFFMDITYDKEGNKKFVQYSLFPIIPSITYRFKF
jgi:hypothetical protein